MGEIIATDKKTKALETAGATRERAYSAMVEGLQATTVVFDKYGEAHEFPDTSNRLKAAEQIARLHGDLKNETVVESRSVNINIVGKESEVKELIGMISQVKAELAGLKDSGRQTGEVIDVVASSS